jgi:hypothetical protein
MNRSLKGSGSWLPPAGQKLPEEEHGDRSVASGDVTEDVDVQNVPRPEEITE